MWIAINYNFITSAINSRRRNREHRNIKSCAWRWIIEISAQSQRLVTAVILQTDIINTVSVFFFIFFGLILHRSSMHHMYTFSLELTTSNARHKGNGSRQFGQMYFPRSIFSKLRVFDFEIREYPNGCFDCLQSRAIPKRQSFQRHIIVNTASKTSARASAHILTFYRIQIPDRIPVLLRIYIYLSGIRKNYIQAGVYSKSIDDMTERSKRRRWKIIILIIILINSLRRKKKGKYGYKLLYYPNTKPRGNKQSCWRLPGRRLWATTRIRIKFIRTLLCNSSTRTLEVIKRQLPILYTYDAISLYYFQWIGNFRTGDTTFGLPASRNGRFAHKRIEIPYSLFY